jgi:N-acylneuraminate cytidylyltransferase
MKTFAFVFARGGSKGVPNKNIRTLAGKPLLGYSIELAMEIDAIDEVFVSTGDPAIAAVARGYGVNVINRPEKLNQDDAPEWLAWQHAVEWIQEQGSCFDVFLSLPTTSPLRNSHDVLSCLSQLCDQTDVVVTITDTNRSPWFNMVQTNDDGFATLLAKGNKSFTRRQDVPKTYDMTTVAYVARPSFIIDNDSLWDGRVKGVVVPIDRSIDIDTELDLEIAEFLMCRRSKGETGESLC